MKLIDYIFIIISALILIPIIFYPYSGDLWIYISGGKVIADGGKILHNFVDLKPPLLFYLFSIIYKVIGNDIIHLRIFEFVLQSGAISLLYLLVKKILSSSLTAFYSSSFYSIVYVCLKHSGTFQTESLLSFILIALIYTRFNIKSQYSYFVQGMLIGLTAGLKYTYLILYLSLILYDIYSWNNIKTFFKEQILTLSGLFTGISITLIMLIDKDIYNGFIDSIQFVYYYSQLMPFDFNFFKNLIDGTSDFFTQQVSLVFFTFIFFGIIHFLTNEKSLKIRNSLFFIYFIFVVLLISVFVEKKFFSYQFSRLYIPLSILFSYGLVNIFDNIKSHFKIVNNNYIIIISFLFLAIIFSPIPRYISTFIPAYYYYTDKDKYNDYYTRTGDTYLNYADMIKIADYVKSIKHNNDKILVVSIGSHIINYYLKNEIISKFPLPLFPLSEVNEKWISEFTDEIKTSNILIIQKDDLHPIVSGYHESSWEKLSKNNRISEILNNFTNVYETKSFIILKKIK